MTPITYDLLNRLPKVELHCHLDGCLRPQSMLEVADQDGISLPLNNVAELDSFLRIGKNRGTLKDYLERFDPDPLRYFLSAAMPETSDSDFSWEEFQRRNNDELVATYGNVVHRVLTFAYRNFDAKVPQPDELTPEDQRLLAQAKETIEAVDTNLGGCHFREGIRLIMSLAQETNRYLESTAPWKTLREDRSRCATSLWTAMNILSTLRLLAYPYLPFSSQKLHEFLGYEGDVADVGWNFADLTPGQELQTPEALFVKLEDETIEQEVQRLQA